MRGGKRPGAGRRAGTKNRTKAEREAAMFDNESMEFKQSNGEIKQSNVREEANLETIDGASGKLDPTLRPIRLNTQKEVRREMSFIYSLKAGRLNRGDTLDEGTVSKLIFSLGKISDTISAHEVEDMMEQIRRDQAAIVQGRQLSNRTGQE